MKSGWADWPVIRRAQTVKFNSSLQVELNLMRALYDWFKKPATGQLAE